MATSSRTKTGQYPKPAEPPEPVEFVTRGRRQFIRRGNREIELERKGGKFVLPGMSVAGPFDSPAAAADWVFTDDRVPVLNDRVTRRNILDLSADDLARLAAAFNHVHAIGLIDDFTQMHVDLRNRIHRVPQFLPWHRWMVREMEKALQRFDPLVSIPYWDSTDPAANNWNGTFIRDFLGGEANSGGQFDHWEIDRSRGDSRSMPSLSDVLQSVRAGSYLSHRTVETNLVHAGGHLWLGGGADVSPAERGHMSGANSPADPAFYFHHCNIDRIWALWQLSHPDVAEPYVTTAASGDVADRHIAQHGDRVEAPPYISGWYSTPTIRHVLDHRVLGYRYAWDDRLHDHAVQQLGEGVAADMVFGDRPAFVVAPNRVDAQIARGEWRFYDLHLTNDTDGEATVEIERSASNNTGPADGFVWWPLSRTIPPGERSNYFVFFAPQHAGFYNFDLDVLVTTSNNATTRINVPLIGNVPNT